MSGLRRVSIIAALVAGGVLLGACSKPAPAAQQVTYDRQCVEQGVHAQEFGLLLGTGDVGADRLYTIQFGPGPDGGVFLAAFRLAQRAYDDAPSSLIAVSPTAAFNDELGQECARAAELVVAATEPGSGS